MILRAIYSVLLVLFLIAATLQVQGLRAGEALAAADSQPNLSPATGVPT